MKDIALIITSIGFVGIVIFGGKAMKLFKSTENSIKRKHLNK